MGVVEGLGGLGAEIEATDDGFVVRGTGRLRGGVIDSRGDHRLAMLGAVAGPGVRGGRRGRGLRGGRDLLPRVRARPRAPAGWVGRGELQPGRAPRVLTCRASGPKSTSARGDSRAVGRRSARRRYGGASRGRCYVDEIRSRSSAGPAPPAPRRLPRGARGAEPEARYLAAVTRAASAALSGQAAAFLFELIRGTAAAARGHDAAQAPRRRRHRRTARSRRRDDLSPHPDRQPCRTPSSTCAADLPAETSPAPATRPASSTAPRPRTSKRCSRDVRDSGAGRLRRVLTGDEPVRSASSSAASSSSYVKTAAAARDQHARRQAPRRLPLARAPRSPSSSTATASTTRGTPGSRTAAASARRGRAATTSAATPTATSFESPGAMLAELRAVISPAW